MRQRDKLTAVLKAIAGNEKGTVAIIMAVALLPVTFAIGAAIDYGRAHAVRTTLQSSLDAAVMDALKEPQTKRLGQARGTFAANSLKIQYSAPTAKFTAIGSDQMNGTATADVGTTFAKLMGISSIQVHVESSAKIAAGAGGSNVCVLLLDPNAYEGFRVNSGADVVAPGCEVHVHSTAHRAANFNSGINLAFDRICIKGSNTTNNFGDVPGLELDCNPIADPFAGKMPSPPSTACQHNNLNFNGGAVSLTPGVYCGWVNFNGTPTVNFAPGVYVIRNGGWNVNGGNWSGSGVTFYFDDQSKIQFNSAVAATLTPPDSGTYKDIMFYERSGLSRSHFVLNDALGFNISGLVYLPSRDTIYNSGSQTHARELTMVFNSLILNETKWTLGSAETVMETGETTAAVLAH